MPGEAHAVYTISPRRDSVPGGTVSSECLLACHVQVIFVRCCCCCYCCCICRHSCPEGVGAGGGGGGETRKKKLFSLDHLCQKSVAIGPSSSGSSCDNTMPAFTPRETHGQRSTIGGGVFIPSIPPPPPPCHRFRWIRRGGYLTVSDSGSCTLRTFSCTCWR